MRNAAGRGLVPSFLPATASLPPLCMLDSTYSPETAWELREFWRPTLVASYWWRGGELKRVHISGCVWGRDLRSAPAPDYRYLPGYPNPELDELRVGLLELRSARYSRPLLCPPAP
ncbi:MAG: hypothetical protein ABIO70_22710 [Pseudomonadota bacterium]